MPQVAELEPRRLFSVLNVASFGAVSGGSNNTQDFQAALNAAKPGDTVSIPAGTYNIASPLNVPTGVTITGASDTTSHLVFNLGQVNYGLVIAGGASNVTIEDLDLVSNYGLIRMASAPQYTNIHITDNRLQYGGGTFSDGTPVFGISSNYLNVGLQITHNYFHDSPNGDRNWEIWYAKDANLDYNVFFNVHDGGSIIEPQGNVSFSYNYGTEIQRMGQEFMGYSDDTQPGLNVIGNNFSQWNGPNPESYGLSVMTNFTPDVVVANNYLDASMAPGSSWGAPDGSGMNRFGIAIEVGGNSPTVEGNTLVGQWMSGVAAATVNTTVKNNQVFGSFPWGDWGGEPGPLGSGSVNPSNNSVDTNVNDAPANPGPGSAGPDGSGAAPTAPSTPATPPVPTTPTAPATPPAPPAPTTPPAPTPPPTPTGGSGSPPPSDGNHAAPVPNDGPFTYLSDMPFTSPYNGWGPVETDESNGEQAADDGHVITIDGATYTKGIGMHADGEVDVALNGNYSVFKSDIGIDDEVLPASGDADIQVWGDGKELDNAGVVYSGHKAVSISVDVAGVQNLAIKAVIAGSKDNAHVDLGYARLYPTGTAAPTSAPNPPSTPSTPTPPTTPPTSGTATYLSDLGFTQIANGWGPAEKDMSNGEQAAGDGHTITIDGQTFAKGLGVHAYSDLQFNLAGNYTMFSSDIGIDDETDGQGAVDFEVFADGTQIYNSGKMVGGEAAKSVTLDVTGVQTLDLVVVTAESGIDFDHADWAGAQVS